MESIIDLISVHDKECMGCSRFDRDIMLSFTIDNKREIHDVFLTQKQAIDLLAELELKVSYNKDIKWKL